MFGSLFGLFTSRRDGIPYFPGIVFLCAAVITCMAILAACALPSDGSGGVKRGQLLLKECDVDDERAGRSAGGDSRQGLQGSSFGHPAAISVGVGEAGDMAGSDCLSPDSAGRGLVHPGGYVPPPQL